jgi:hypothetical protein
MRCSSGLVRHPCRQQSFSFFRSNFSHPHSVIGTKSFGRTAALAFKMRRSQLHHTLWRYLEKGAENLWKAVDEIQGFNTSGSVGATFSAILTNNYLESIALCRGLNGSCSGFHRFTAIITTTSLIVFGIRNTLLGSEL